MLEMGHFVYTHTASVGDTRIIWAGHFFSQPKYSVNRPHLDIAVLSTGPLRVWMEDHFFAGRRNSDACAQSCGSATASYQDQKLTAIGSWIPPGTGSWIPLRLGFGRGLGTPNRRGKTAKNAALTFK